MGFLNKILPANKPAPDGENVVILGCGRRGMEWAQFLVSQNMTVRMYDPIPEIDKFGPTQVQNMIKDMDAHQPKSILRGIAMKKQLKLVTGYQNLNDALYDANFILECIPENLELKQKCISDVADVLTNLKNQSAILGSTTTSFDIAALTSTPENEAFKTKNCLLIQAVEPVYYNQVVEVIPGPETAKASINKVKQWLESMQKKPIIHMKNQLGSAIERFHAVMMYQAWQYYKEGILTIPEIDFVAREGMAPYYLFSGPFEAAQIEGKGFAEYCDKNAKRIQEIVDKPGNFVFPTPKEIRNDEELNKFLIHLHHIEIHHRGRNAKLHEFIPK